MIYFNVKYFSNQKPIYLCFNNKTQKYYLKQHIGEYQLFKNETLNLNFTNTLKINNGLDVYPFLKKIKNKLTLIFDLSKEEKEKFIFNGVCSLEFEIENEEFLHCTPLNHLFEYYDSIKIEKNDLSFITFQDKIYLLSLKTRLLSTKIHFLNHLSNDYEKTNIFFNGFLKKNVRQDKIIGKDVSSYHFKFKPKMQEIMKKYEYIGLSRKKDEFHFSLFEQQFQPNKILSNIYEQTKTLINNLQKEESTIDDVLTRLLTFKFKVLEIKKENCVGYFIYELESIKLFDKKYLSSKEKQKQKELLELTKKFSNYFSSNDDLLI